MRRPSDGAIRGFMMVSMGRMVILGWISFISIDTSKRRSPATVPEHLLDWWTRPDAVLVSSPRTRKADDMISGRVVWVVWPLVAGLAVVWQMRRHAGWRRILGAVALCTYALWICSVAFFPLPLGASAAANAGRFAGRAWVNAAPLRELLHTLPLLTARQIIREFGGNFLLFVPFTLFGPLLWPRLRTWWWPLAAGLGGSVAIELIQLGLSGLVGYPYRQTDIDDVIINTAGAFLGYGLFELGRRLAALTAPAPR